MSIFKQGIYFGISICDITTGEFYSSEIKNETNFPQLLDEIARYTPSELVVNPFLFECTEQINKIKERFNTYITKYDAKKFKTGNLEIQSKFKLENTDGKEITDLSGKELLCGSINSLFTYIEETQKTTLKHINKIVIYITSKYMSLDINARRNLEITEKMKDNSKKGTLLWVLDKTSTSMGSRLLRRWINDPLIDIKEINR